MADRKFRKAADFWNRRGDKWGEELIDSINKMNLNEEEKDFVLLFTLKKVLYRTPYPNRKIIETLGRMIVGISSEDVVPGYIDWEARETAFRKSGIT